MALLAAALTVPGIGFYSLQAAASGDTAGNLSGPAAVIAGVTRVSAVVEAVDRETREVTLKSETGNSVIVTAGPEVRNFDQIEVGDKVVTEYYEALALVLEKGGMGIREKVEQVSGSRAELGEKPAGSITKTIDAVATVEGMDKETRMIHLRGPEGTLSLKVPETIDMDQFAVGDEVRARYEESVAITVSEK
jgi:Cu/Ag efflux protein CusF